MKSLFLIPIFFSTTVLCFSQRNMDKKGSTEIFMQKVGDRSMNWLELMHQKDSISGIFYGYDKLSDGTPIYYKANLKNLTIADGSIQFILTEYLLSDRPFGIENSQRKFYIKDTNKVPALLKFSQNFSGIKSSYNLKLRRTSVLYDSRADELTLIKVK